jgi:hypothetical protein
VENNMPGEVEGFIGQEEVILKNAATETTLQLLVQAVNAANPNKGSAARLQKMYQEALEKTTKGQVDALKKLQEEEKSRNDINKLLEKEQEKRKKFIEDMDGVSRVLSRGFTAIFSTATPKLSDLTNALSGIPILGPVIGALGQTTQDTIDNFRELSSVGADLGNNITDVRTAAKDAGMSLDTFRQIVMNNSTTLAGLSANSTLGIKRFMELSKSINHEVQPRLSRLGFSLEETAEGMMNYIELQTQLGRISKMSDRELRINTEEYLLELDQLSRATGMQRKTIMDLQKQQLIDKNIRNVTLGMSDAQRKEYQKTTIALQAAGHDVENFAKLVASGGVGLDDQSRQLARLHPEIRAAAAAFSQQRGTFEGTAAAFNQARLATQGASAEQFRITARLGVMGKDYLSPLITTFAQTKEMAISLTDAQDAQLKALDEASKSAANVDQTFLNLRNIFMHYLSPVLNTFIESVGGFANLMDSSQGPGKRLKEFIENLANGFKELYDILTAEDGGLGAAFKHVATKIVDILVPVLGEALYKMFTHPTVLTTLGIAFTAVIGLAVAKAVATAAIGSIMGAGGVAAGKGAASAGIGIGRGAQGLGQGLGRGLGGLTEGVLKGVAGGLSAFSNPKILLGAGILGASIGVIGAGIAGASWLMGKSLPTLAEGMKSMEDLNGDRLTSAGYGLAAIGAGLATFSLTSLGSSVAGVFDNLVTGVGKLFGAKSPMDKLREFAVVGNDLGNAAQGFTAFKLAITDMPLNSLSFSDAQLNNLDIGTAKIRRLSNTLTSVREEMRSISSPSITEAVSGAIKDIGTTITAKLSGEKIAKEKTVESLMTDLNTKVDRLNNSMTNLVQIQERVAPSVEKTATYAKRSSGNLRPG